jgi:Tfp pilus assembly protein PilO
MKLALPDPSTMSRRERLMLTAAALVICLVVLDRLVLGPWWRHIATVRREIRRLETSIDTYRQLLTRAPQINKSVDAYREYLRPAGAEPPNLAALLREIESLGTESGGSLGEVKPSEGAANAFYQEYAIDVQFQGSVEQTIHLLHLLQSSKLLFGLQRATLQRSREDPGTIAATLRLTSKVFKAPSTAAPPAAGGA